MQALDALADALGRGIRINEAESVEPAVMVRIEDRAPQDGAALGLRGRGDGVTRDAVRQVDPQEEAAFGSGPFRLAREHGLERVEHGVATGLVDRAALNYVRLEVELLVPNQMDDCLLEQRVRVEVEAALCP